MAMHRKRMGRTEATGETAIGAAAPNANEIPIDIDAGISEEDQRDILSQINGIAEKNRQSLTSGESLKGKVSARKSGRLFPVLVNAFAVAALAGGFVALSALQGEVDVQAREGARVFNPAERALIEEIRRDTNASLFTIDQEISMILASLEAVETRIQEIAGAGGEPTDGQMAEWEMLRVQREEYGAALAQSREERSRILTAARSQESLMQDQLNARARDLDAQEARVEAELGAAREELAALSREQAQTAAAEAQVGALFANIQMQIAQGRFDDAARATESLRGFLGATAAPGAQARWELFGNAADAVESLLGIAGGDAMRQWEIENDLRSQIRALEAQVAGAQLNNPTAAPPQPTSLTITGIPANHNGRQAVARLLNANNEVAVSQNVVISGGSVTLGMLSPAGAPVSVSGNHAIDLSIMIDVFGLDEPATIFMSRTAPRVIGAGANTAAFAGFVATPVTLMITGIPAAQEGRFATIRLMSATEGADRGAELATAPDVQIVNNMATVSLIHSETREEFFARGTYVISLVITEDFMGMMRPRLSGVSEPFNITGGTQVMPFSSFRGALQ